MCTYLYAAFSLRSGTDEGLNAEEADATARWRRDILKVAIEEMGHLTAVWNITAALGGSPRFGRTELSAGPGRVAGERGSQAGAVQRSRAAALHLSRAADEFGRARRRGVRRGLQVHARRFAAARHAHAHRLRHRGRVLRNAVEEREGFRRARRREGGVLRRSQSAALAQGNRLPGLRSGDLLDHRAQGVRCHRQPGRRRVDGERGLALLPLHRHPRRAARAAREESGCSAGVSRGRESRAAPAGARRRARVARERRNRGHGGRRQHRIHADAAADLAFLSIAAAASGEGAVRGPRARASCAR